MKRKTKLGLGIAVLTFGLITLSGCTASFCSNCDNAHMLYAYDNGVTKYYDTDNEEHTRIKLNNFDSLYADISYDNNCGSIPAIDKSARESNFIQTPHIDFWGALDNVLLNHILNEVNIIDHTSTADEVNEAVVENGYLKYAEGSELTHEKPALWDNFYDYIEEARYMVGEIDKCPTTDYLNLYKTTMNNYIVNNRACIATQDGKYGNIGVDGNHKTSVTIESKSYGYAWNKGFLEGLLIWPIGAFVDVLCNGLSGLGTGLNGTNGWAQLLSILIVTVLIRGIMFALTFKQTAATAKMTELQPEITKIQNKYPAANTNTAEKARMAQEMQALYKKHKINPFGSIIVLIIQFPVFICVWGALSGSAWLATGSFCNLNLSDSISSVLFNGDCWSNGSAVTALILFILMAASQVVSMLLPQWMQKRRQKNVAKLGKNPSAKSQNNKMKWVTYIMMIFIIIMGFSLASAMGVYWLVGALFSIAQTLITQKITDNKAKKEKK